MRLIAACVLVASCAIAIPTGSHALSVTIEGGPATGTVGETFINLIRDGEAFATYGNFRVETCSMNLGCSGRPARAEILGDGALGTVKQLRLTDALISVVSATADLELDIVLSHQFSSVPNSPPQSEGGYPFGVAMSGVFSRTTGGLPLGDTIQVTSTVTNTDDGDIVLPSTPEVINQFGPAPPSLSLAVAGLLARNAFGQREQDAIACLNQFVVKSCLALLETRVTVTFGGLDTLRLPGSIDTLFSEDRDAFDQAFQEVGNEPTSVPAPAALSLLATGLGGLIIAAGRKRFRGPGAGSR